MLTDLAHLYQTASAGWMTAGLAYALRLFFLLATIEIAVFSIYELFRKDGTAEFFASLIIRVLGLLFSYVLLIEAPAWIPTIIQSFTKAGAAIGQVATLDPSSVFEQGITVATTALQGVNNASIFSSLLLIVVAGISALIIVLSYAVVAAQLLITLVESYIVIGGGVLMLGFAGSRWTTVFTERYFGYLVSVGIKLFVLFLIIGLGTGLGPQFAKALAPATANALPDLGRYLDILGGAFVFMIMAWHVPGLAASMMTGAPSLTAGTALNTTLVSVAAAVTALNKTLAGISNKPTASASALTEATRLTGDKAPLPSPVTRSETGLNTASSPPRGDIKATRPPPAPAARSGINAVSPHLPDDRAHGNITIRFNKE